MYFRLCSLLLFFQGLFSPPCKAQQPGLPGMAPSKWITLETTQSPGKIYRTTNTQSQKYSQEDIFFRAWLPVFHKSNFAIVIGPNYRTEQLELQNEGNTEKPISQLCNWQLRSMGVDIKSFVQLDSTSWLILSGRVHQSGNLRNTPFQNVPLNYTFSSVYLKKLSLSKEIGFGFMINRNDNLSVLPVFVYNQNFSARSGIEIMLPKKIAWRYNLSAKDILYVKSEAVSRTYFITGPTSDEPGIFRRIDVDTGISYNRQINKFIGVELFSGYRQNVSNHLPEGIIPVKTSGFVASVELYIKPPQFKKK